jgi:tetratricopeptide (TPR) repeat protein
MSLLLIFIAGCASNEEPKLNIDTELYAGIPMDSLTSEEMPKTELEAITRADAALAQRKYDLALYEYIRSLAFPDAEYQDKSLYNIGRIHQSRDNFPLAEKAYLRALQYNPNHVDVLNQLGVMYSKGGRVLDGKVYFIRAVNADQARLNNEQRLESFDLLTEQQVTSLLVDRVSPIQSYMGMGVLSDIDAKYDVAKRFYEKALEIDPRSVSSMINLGYSHYMSGNHHMAKRLMTTALQYEPSNEKALNNLALVHLSLGETTQALNVFMRQMEAPEALNNVGYFLILQGKPDEAIPYLQQAIDKKPSYYKLANENLSRALAEVRVMKIKKGNQSSDTESESGFKVQVVKP